MTSHQFNEDKYEHILDHIHYLLNNPEISTVIVEAGIHEFCQREGIYCPDVYYVLRNIDQISQDNDACVCGNCYLVSGETIDGMRLSVTVLTDGSSMNARLLSVEISS